MIAIGAVVAICLLCTCAGGAYLPLRPHDPFGDLPVVRPTAVLR
ncbi:hypothetical protein AB0M47_03945 [Hamadaea sp. NPDC051192]